MWPRARVPFDQCLAHEAVDCARPQATGRRGGTGRCEPPGRPALARADSADCPRGPAPRAQPLCTERAKERAVSEPHLGPARSRSRCLGVGREARCEGGRGEAKKRPPQTNPSGPTNGATTLTLLLLGLLPRARREQDTGYIRAPTHPRGQRARRHGHGGRRRRPVGRGHHQPQRVAPAALLRGRHLHRAQPQHPPPAPRGLRRRRLPVPPGRGLLPQCGRVPVRLLLLRRGLLPAHRAPRRRPRPPRARARDVLRPRRRRLARAPRRRRRRPRARGPAQEAHDQEPRVGVPLPRAQAGPRHPDRVGGAPAARGERAAPPQVRPAQGFGGGVGAGAEDAAEGALGALLIFLPEGVGMGTGSHLNPLIVQ